MTTKLKKKSATSIEEPPIKKLKKVKKSTIQKEPDSKTATKKVTKTTKTDVTVKKDSKKEITNKTKGVKKAPPFNKTSKMSKQQMKSNLTKPADWNEFKKQKKELRMKRRENRNQDIVVKVKHIAEKLRCKNLEGGVKARCALVEQAHKILSGKGHYQKFVMMHDMARAVQYLIKFGSPEVRSEIVKELLPNMVEILQSKYGRYVIKTILKRTDSKTRSSVIRSFYGNSVKLSSHAVSADIFATAYSTWASPLEKHHLLQEFFGDIYKQNKDDNIKHLSDVYKDSPDMKSAALTATKSNLGRILNKNLYNSDLIHTVLNQFLSECTNDDRNELLAQLLKHVVILSNSKDGARVVMKCIWYGSSKDRKLIMKTLKEFLIDLSKHEHGHTVIITLMDTVDDTVLLNKIILVELLKHVKDLVVDEWGRKVILWLIAPGESLHFHPLFIKELEAGRENSTCKKSPEVRRNEILNYSSTILLNYLATEPQFWLSNASIAVVSLAILKTGSGNGLQKALESITKVIVDPEWKIKSDAGEFRGIEHAGLHVILKKLAQHDGVQKESSNPTFGAALLNAATEQVLESWINLNRGCFLLVAVLENTTDKVRGAFQDLLKPLSKKIKKQKTAGAKILLTKLN